MNEEHAAAIRQSAGWPGFLRVLSRRHFSPFRTYVNRGRRTVVVLNPKVGTKSFRQAMTSGLREIHGIADPSGGRYPMFRKAREFQIARVRDYAHAFRYPAEYQFFCFVRNPYARLRSAWLSKFAYGHLQGYSRSIRRCELARLRRFAKAMSLPGGAEGAAIPFESFLAYVESQPAGSRDHHWDDQYHVLLMDDVRYTGCFPMERDFVVRMCDIFEHIGLSGEVMNRLAAVHLNASPGIAAPVYTTALAARVLNLYSRDFSVLGYDPESWRGL
jgi:hypothetical protein